MTIDVTRYVDTGTPRAIGAQAAPPPREKPIPYIQNFLVLDGRPITLTNRPITLGN